MLLGLTGSIGSGKSTVVDFIKQKGMPVIDSDSIAREIVEPERQAWKEIVEYFGDEILLPDKRIDRKKLGDIIFRSLEERKVLELITHPRIIDEMMIRANDLKKYNEHVLIDVPLLFETQSEKYFDLIIVVYTDKKKQVERLMLRDNIDEEEALLKISTQMDIEKKRRKADIVIYNNKDLQETKKQVEKIFTNLSIK